MVKRCLLVATAALLACSESPTEPASLSQAPGPLADGAANGSGTPGYQVTIYNLTEGQPLTPPLVATHRQGLHVFRPGMEASEGVKEIAENGNPAALEAALGANPSVDHVGMGPGAVLPLGSLSFMVEGTGPRLSWVSMLICTNDGFTGLRSLRLPEQIGQEKTRYVKGYDAGTEINTESFSDMVPPCPMITGVPTTEMGTGTSNPALAEGGVIRRHGGIEGVDDLLPYLHGWTDPVAKVVVRRIY